MGMSPHERHADRCARPLCGSMATALLAGVAASVLLISPPATASAEGGIHNIQHVIMIMQENRTLDEYFGTYPGANGIPPNVCVHDPTYGGCQKPYHDPYP